MEYWQLLYIASYPGTYMKWNGMEYWQLLYIASYPGTYMKWNGMEYWQLLYLASYPGTYMKWNGMEYWHTYAAIVHEITTFDSQINYFSHEAIISMETDYLNWPITSGATPSSSWIMSPAEHCVISTSCCSCRQKHNVQQCLTITKRSC